MGGPLIGTAQLFLVGLAIAVGLVGIVVPGVPGLALVAGAGLWWAVADGGTVGHWIVFGVMAAFGIAGALAQFVLPARAVATEGAGRFALLAGAVGAVVGFFLVPVVGLPLGGVAGIYLAEYARLGEAAPAAATTKAVLVAFGIGLLAQLAAGLAMAATWGLGLLAT